ncbi:hypothetical protein EYF80_021895 [Liparis tanakae]|uniref:Uncharacterized protein n=1 Tax=Liparis tanakae TaxID=230148 RepID=A0A4Z2HQ09_9TELE|nr:hypothetical protein EYF80_021895 [Liparis tanakae]
MKRGLVNALLDIVVDRRPHSLLFCRQCRPFVSFPSESQSHFLKTHTPTRRPIPRPQRGNLEFDELSDARVSSCICGLSGEHDTADV